MLLLLLPNLGDHSDGDLRGINDRLFGGSGGSDGGGSDGGSLSEGEGYGFRLDDLLNCWWRLLTLSG